eukprot:scaffold7245_cov290-Prasinococcus_capsulatus_cf.AAC.1
MEMGFAVRTDLPERVHVEERQHEQKDVQVMAEPEELKRYPFAYHLNCKAHDGEQQDHHYISGEASQCSQCVVCNGHGLIPAYCGSIA